MLTAVVLSHNEDAHLSRCLSSLKFADQLLVIDDSSTDDTRAVAASFSARVVSHPLNSNFSAQRNFALSQIRSGWVLFVDADEVVSSPLRFAITSAVGKLGINGYFIPREDFLWGRALTHGDNRVELLRLARKGSGHWFGKVHESWLIRGPVGRLSFPLLHYPHPTVAEFVSHIDRYSTIRAGELHHESVRVNIFSVILFPLGKFLHLYLIKLGFLDGMPGLISALMMSFYSFLVRAKLYLLYRHV